MQPGMDPGMQQMHGMAPGSGQMPMGGMPVGGNYAPNLGGGGPPMGGMPNHNGGMQMGGMPPGGM